MSRYAVCAYWLYLCFIGFLNYYWVSLEWFTILWVLMVTDTILWIGKAYALYRATPDRFSTDKIILGVMKKASILMVLMLLAASLGFMSQQSEITFFLIDAILWMLICAELISNIQNALMIRRQKYIPERDAMGVVLEWILGALRKIVENKTKN